MKMQIKESLAKELIQQFGSPLYVYDKNAILHNCNKFKNTSIANLQQIYALKANYNPSIVKIIQNCGFGLDLVSIGELELAKKLNFETSKLLYTGFAPNKKEIRYIAQNGILINIGSLDILENYGQIAPNTKVCLRLNLECGAGFNDKVITSGRESKFGISRKHIVDALRICNEYNLSICGLHSHIGSNIMNVKELQIAYRMLFAFAVELNIKSLEFVDIGGGFGIPYHEDDKELDLKAFFNELNDDFGNLCDALKQSINLLIEPGRFVIASAGTLLTTVNSIKETGNKNFICVDAGFNNVIRPAFYNAYHHITNLSQQLTKSDKTINYDIVGNICETGDVFGSNRKMPITKVNDIVAIHDTGAYSYSMSSNYNMNVSPAECIIEGDKYKLIRERQSIDDLINAIGIKYI